MADDPRQPQQGNAEYLPRERDDWRNRASGPQAHTVDPIEPGWRAESWNQPAPPAARKRPQKLWLHILLFLATIATTVVMQSAVYSLCLMSILTAHEFGHYFAARYYRVTASLPFFIPAPFLFGTMGAVIRMSSGMPHRKALFDIAAAGPIAGIVLAIPVSFYGILTSERIPLEELVSEAGQVGIQLGDPLLFQAFERILHGTSEADTVLLLNSYGFAGWVGLFVTALNLLPIGQLDGGHICHAVFARRSAIVSRLAFAAMAASCVLVSPQFALLLALLLFSGIRHRETRNDALPLGRGRGVLAIVLLAVFAVCFTPTPINVGSFS